MNAKINLIYPFITTDVRDTEYEAEFIHEKYGYKSHCAWLPALESEEVRKWLFSHQWERGEKKSMKTIRVVAAVIREDEKIFATARGYGDYKGGWEFPGGKIETGETPQEALKREIMEELETEISVGDLIDTIEYDYPNFHLSMDCFWCEVIQGDLILKEAQEARWLSKDELFSVNWLPADITLIEKIQKLM